jgi:lipopolysaccharide transport protein LptA
MRQLMLPALAALLLVGAAGPEVGAQGSAPRPRNGTPAPKPPAPSDKAKDDDKNAPLIVDSDSLDSFQKQGLAIFKGNVIARQNNSVQYADKMEVYTDSKTDRVERVVSTGNVRIITRDCRMGTAERAEYYDAEQRVVLIGNAGMARRRRGHRRPHHDLHRRGPKRRGGGQAGAGEGHLLPEPKQAKIRDQVRAGRPHMPLIWKA